MQYPATFTEDDTKILVTFRDVPEAITQGDNMDEAMMMAKDALITALQFYTENNKPLPIASQPMDGEYLIRTQL